MIILFYLFLFVEPLGFLSVPMEADQRPGATGNKSVAVRDDLMRMFSLVTHSEMVEMKFRPSGAIVE